MFLVFSSFCCLSNTSLYLGSSTVGSSNWHTNACQKPCHPSAGRFCNSLCSRLPPRYLAQGWGLGVLSSSSQSPLFWVPTQDFSEMSPAPLPSLQGQPGFRVAEGPQRVAATLSITLWGRRKQGLGMSRGGLQRKRGGLRAEAEGGGASYIPGTLMLNLPLE